MGLEELMSGMRCKNCDFPASYCENCFGVKARELDSSQRALSLAETRISMLNDLCTHRSKSVDKLLEERKVVDLQNGVMRKALEDIAKREGAGLDGSTENATGRKARLALEGKYETPCPTCGYSYWMGSCCTHCGFVENRDGDSFVFKCHEKPPEHIGGEGYAGVPIKTAIVHDKHCCASIGCHRVCSHLCGTELEAKCCKPRDTEKRNGVCELCGKKPREKYCEVDHIWLCQPCFDDNDDE